MENSNIDSAKKDWKKAAKYALGTILLGALGSGFWNLFLSDFLYYIISNLVKVSGSVSSFYLEQLHHDIGKGLTERTSYLLLLFLLVSIIIFLFLFSVRYFIIYLYSKINSITKKLITQNSEENKHIVPKWKKRETVIKCILFSILFILYTLFLYQEIYSYRAIVFIERSIEILSPYITHDEFLILRSKYRAIDTSKKFYDLEDNLKTFAKKNKIELPEFRSIK